MIANTAKSVLAIDIGGTKLLAALISGDRIVESLSVPTPRQSGPGEWLAGLFDPITSWRGRYDRVGVAATGLVEAGIWNAVTANTLDVPRDFPLSETVANLSGCPVIATNDAQAAAWGEFKFGAGEGEDMVFLTISTGIGGGVVVNGHLLQGLAGHFGAFRLHRCHGTRDAARVLEDFVTGRWIAGQAENHIPGASARDVFGAARDGRQWAAGIIAASAKEVSILCRNLQMAFDPRRIVIGGGIGLADDYLEQVSVAAQAESRRFAPRLVRARLGVMAGAIGVADLATTHAMTTSNRE